jgi:hypothetical protein
MLPPGAIPMPPTFMDESEWWCSEDSGKEFRRNNKVRDIKISRLFCGHCNCDQNSRNIWNLSKVMLTSDKSNSLYHNGIHICHANAKESTHITVQKQIKLKQNSSSKSQTTERNKTLYLSPGKSQLTWMVASRLGVKRTEHGVKYFIQLRDCDSRKTTLHEARSKKTQHTWAASASER